MDGSGEERATVRRIGAPSAACAVDSPSVEPSSSLSASG